VGDAEGVDFAKVESGLPRQEQRKEMVLGPEEIKRGSEKTRIYETSSERGRGEGEI